MAGTLMGRTITGSPLNRSSAANLEQAWRSLIPVDSFVSEPAEVRPEVVKPHVGIRWGKPADFEFNLDDAALPETQNGRASDRVTYNAPIVYDTVDITTFSEVFRKYRTGTIQEGNLEIEAEDTREWLVDGNTSHSFMTKDIWGVEYEREVNVFFNFKLGGGSQVDFAGSTSLDDRGEYPEGQKWQGVEELKNV